MFSNSNSRIKNSYKNIQKINLKITAQVAFSIIKFYDKLRSFCQ